MKNPYKEYISKFSVTGLWKKIGLYESIFKLLKRRYLVSRQKCAQYLYQDSKKFYFNFRKLFNQIKWINVELLLGKVDDLRSKFKISKIESKKQFIGDMKAFNLGEHLEYWPFEGEYWRDELGGYVYNITSKCNKQK